MKILIIPGVILLTILAVVGFFYWQHTSGQDFCDRTPGVQNSILESLGKDLSVSPCNEVSSEELKSVTFVNLGFKNLTRLRDEDLNGLTNLEVLRLDYNGFGSLPEGFFEDNPNLRELHLSGNKMISLPYGLNNLEKLDLSYNSLTSLRSGVFDDFKNVKNLDLSGNNLSSLPPGVFDGLNSMEKLNLGYNRLTSLPDGTFDELTNLEVLSLNDNLLASLPDGAFDGLNDLIYLDLSGNNLSVLPEEIFDSQNNLQYLLLNDNPLTGLPSGVFDSLSGLVFLGISNTHLFSFPERVFKNLLKLETLHASQESPFDCSPLQYSESSRNHNENPLLNSLSEKGIIPVCSI